MVGGANLQFIPHLCRLVATSFRFTIRRPKVRFKAAPLPSSKETTMTTNLRALIFGIAATAAITLTFDALGAAGSVQPIRLEAIEVRAHSYNFDSEGNLKVTRLDPITVTAHKNVN